MSDTKTVTTKEFFPVTLFRADNDFLACVSGHPIDKGEYYGVCPDCGAIFCETCMLDGTFENHSCDDEENY